MPRLAVSFFSGPFHCNIALYGLDFIERHRSPHPRHNGSHTSLVGDGRPAPFQAIEANQSPLGGCEALHLESTDQAEKHQVGVGGIVRSFLGSGSIRDSALAQSVLSSDGDFLTVDFYYISVSPDTGFTTEVDVLTDGDLFAVHINTLPNPSSRVNTNRQKNKKRCGASPSPSVLHKAGGLSGLAVKHGRSSTLGSPALCDLSNDPPVLHPPNAAPGKVRDGVPSTTVRESVFECDLDHGPSDLDDFTVVSVPISDLCTYSQVHEYILGEEI